LALLGAYGVVIFATPAVLGLNLPAIVAVLATIVVGLVLGIVLERIVFRHFIGEPVLSVIIVTLALGGIINGLLRFLVGPNFRSYPAALKPGWSIDLPLGASIGASFTLGVVLSLVVVVSLMLFFRYTVTGSILRAAAADEQAAMVLGVSIERTIIIAWALSIAITSIGGILLAMASGGAGFTIESVGIIIFAAVVFGGLDSIPGAFLGALVVGVLQEYGGYYATEVIGPGAGEIIPMVFLLVVIIIKPRGLFGTERIERI
jgi:Branched-chain amino acid ABC-type transport system, permease components